MCVYTCHVNIHLACKNVIWWNETLIRSHNFVGKKNIVLFMEKKKIRIIHYFLRENMYCLLFGWTTVLPHLLGYAAMEMKNSCHPISWPTHKWYTTLLCVCAFSPMPLFILLPPSVIATCSFAAHLNFLYAVLFSWIPNEYRIKNATIF